MKLFLAGIAAIGSLWAALPAERSGSERGSAEFVVPADADTVDYWHVFLDSALVVGGPAARQRKRLALEDLRGARLLQIRYVTDTGGEVGARVVAVAAGPDGRREIASRIVGAHGAPVAFGTAELLRALRAGDRLVVRIELANGGANDFLLVGWRGGP